MKRFVPFFALSLIIHAAVLPSATSDDTALLKRLSSDIAKPFERPQSIDSLGGRLLFTIAADNTLKNDQSLAAKTQATQNLLQYCVELAKEATTLTNAPELPPQHASIFGELLSLPDKEIRKTQICAFLAGESRPSDQHDHLIPDAQAINQHLEALVAYSEQFFTPLAALLKKTYPNDASAENLDVQLQAILKIANEDRSKNYHAIQQIIVQYNERLMELATTLTNKNVSPGVVPQKSEVLENIAQGVKNELTGEFGAPLLRTIDHAITFIALLEASKQFKSTATATH